jgi:hypothetical protein
MLKYKAFSVIYQLPGRFFCIFALFCTVDGLLFICRSGKFSEMKPEIQQTSEYKKHGLRIPDNTAGRRQQLYRAVAVGIGGGSGSWRRQNNFHSRNL